jgi:large conductance mechanosensitive channel
MICYKWLGSSMHRIISWIKQFADEFKIFALRGNVLDLAIGVVIGAAFNKIVTSVVEDLLMPFLGLFFLGAFDLSTLKVSVGNTTFAYGHFLQSMLDFLIMAFGIFLIVKAVNILKKKKNHQFLIKITKFLKQCTSKFHCLRLFHSNSKSNLF